MRGLRPEGSPLYRMAAPAVKRWPYLGVSKGLCTWDTGDQTDLLSNVHHLWGPVSRDGISNAVGEHRISRWPGTYQSRRSGGI